MGAAALLLFALSASAQSSYDLILDEGRRLLETHKSAEAAKVGLRALEANPNRWEGYLLVATALVERKLYAGALPFYYRAYVLAPPAHHSVLQTLIDQAVVEKLSASPVPAKPPAVTKKSPPPVGPALPPVPYSTDRPTVQPAPVTLGGFWSCDGPPVCSVQITKAGDGWTGTYADNDKGDLGKVRIDVNGANIEFKNSLITFFGMVNPAGDVMMGTIRSAVGVKRGSQTVLLHRYR